jgi:tRNA threonylcarbamoyl adenosine modification protein (Sua5/YciO/YrdC/YwlC family)
MATRVLTITDPVLQEKEVQEAAKALAGGDLIVFPTETVYGVGASAVNAEAIAQLSQLKSRSPDKPFTLHLADPSEAERYAGPLPLVAQRLIRKAWPGPLTIVAPDARPTRAGPAGLVEEAIYYQGTVGLRCPRGAVVQAILSAAGVPVAGSSANLGGRPAPRNAREALASLEGKVALVVDAGPTMYAVASTVVRVGADGSWEVLREGVIPLRRLKRLVRTRILFVCSGNLCRSPMAAGLAARLLANRMGCDPAALPEHGVEVEIAGTKPVRTPSRSCASAASTSPRIAAGQSPLTRC